LLLTLKNRKFLLFTKENIKNYTDSQVSLAFAAPKKAPPPAETDRRKGAAARGVQRSPSAASNSNTSVLR